MSTPPSHFPSPATPSDVLSTRPNSRPIEVAILPATRLTDSADLAPQQDLGLLRFITCGSVDDGKSTLIGRLLIDSRSVHQDQIDAVERSSKQRGGDRIDLALLTDGLKAEREQGITIDVAYRYFSTSRRTFILADTPGHVQYTRNMATAASTADAAVILVDARKGILEQTRRHACLAALLGIRHLIVAVNKMDLINFDQQVFDRLQRDFADFAAQAAPDGLAPIARSAEVTFIPICATEGDNVVVHSTRTPWYSGPTLLAHLESLPDRPTDDADSSSSDTQNPRAPLTRLSIQSVIRPQTPEHHDYRGYAGQVAIGALRVGDPVVALPGGQSSRIKRIHIGQTDLAACCAPQSVTILLEDDLDISRGDLLVPASQAFDSPDSPVITRELWATIIWMHTQPLTLSKKVLIKHAGRYISALVRAIDHRIDIASLKIESGISQLALNEIGKAQLRLSESIACDSYQRCRATGAFIIIDEQSNNTIGAGLIL